MPRTIGYVGDTDHDQWIRRFTDIENYFREELSPWFDTFVDNWKLYLAQKEDKRKEGEEWRANVFVPYPFSGLETKVAAIMDLMNAADRYVQAEGVGPEDDDLASGPETLLDYTLRMNNFRTRIAGNVMRSAGIQGAECYQIAWRNNVVPVTFQPDLADLAELQEAIATAVEQGAPQPPSPVQNPAEFKLWAKMVTDSGKSAGKTVPDILSKQEVTLFKGPHLRRRNITEMRFDPRIEDWNEQPVIMARTVVDESYVRAMVKKGAFDESQVAKALQGYGIVGAEGGDEQFQKWQSQVAEMLKIRGVPFANPLMSKPIEIFEVYEPKAVVKYAVVMNRKAVVNTQPDRMPYDHQECPVQIFRNHPIPGFAIGMSEFTQSKSLYKEMNALRSLRLDAVLISLLPVLLRQKSAGMPELRRLFKPGMVLDVENVQALQQLNKHSLDPSAFREVFDIKTDIDETNSTPSHLRGGAATVGRVSATESQTRVSQAMVRMKDSLVRAEDEFNPIVKQPLFLWYQLGDPEVILQTSGGKNPYKISKREIYESLSRDFRFRGASRAVNRELLAQQTMQFLKDFQANMAPVEVRTGMKKAAEYLGMRGVDQIIQDKFTDIAQKSWEQKMLGQAAPVDPSKPGMVPEGGDPSAPQLPEGTPQDVGEKLQESLEFNEGGGLGAAGNPGQAPGQPA